MGRQDADSSPVSHHRGTSCHGDLQGNFNTNFCEDNTYTHFDFDLCGYGWRAYDLAAFKLSQILIEEDDELVESLWNAFLKGYTEVRPLSENDRAAVSLMADIEQKAFFKALSEKHAIRSQG
ncbi:phosphotransferase [Brevibacillus sp. NPDC003359]|uniref:phosphotransferase n=1 Tax=unclassified Brevibacillus TaxID=2684853 RepID=UPI00368A16FD